MIPFFTTLAKSITGKIVLGLTVATMGVGAAAAAGTEMPSLTNTETAGEETGEQTGEQTAEETGEQTAEETGEQTAEETGEAVEASDAGPTHGDVVSAFTQETDLVGCAKGQATAAVARGDVDPSSPTLIDELAPYLAKCSEAAVTDDAEADDADEAQPTEDEDGWKGVRDENKAAWHDAKDAFVAACGDDDADDAEGDEDAEPTPECKAMKAELKQLHTDGRTEWHDARDAEHAERKAERAEGNAERAASKASQKGGSGKGESGKGKSGKD